MMTSSCDRPCLRPRKIPKPKIRMMAMSTQLNEKFIFVSACSLFDSDVFSQIYASNLRMSRQPKSNVRRARVPGIKLKHRQVMLSRAFHLTEALGAKIREQQ